MSNNLRDKIYYYAAWVIAGAAGLALILYAVALRNSALLGAGAVLDGIFVGITGCLVFLHLAGRFKNSGAMFIMAWVVGGLSLLSMIFSAAGTSGEYSAGAVFWHIALGGFCTLILLHFSGRLPKAK